MNQILLVKDNKEFNKKSFALKTQFIFYFIIFISLILIFIYMRYNSQKNSNQIAANLSNSYHVYRLYANNTSLNKTSNNPYIIGSIEIPKLNISYPVFSTLTEELLKVSPCRFYGEITDDSNLCIAGHNLDNNAFFSRIRTLVKNDKIIITDKSNYKYTFSVFDNYEVLPSDLSPIYSTKNNKKELTLVTCNNKNDKRIIIKSKLIFTN